MLLTTDGERVDGIGSVQDQGPRTRFGNAKYTRGSGVKGNRLTESDINATVGLENESARVGRGLGVGEHTTV